MDEDIVNLGGFDVRPDDRSQGSDGYLTAWRLTASNPNTSDVISDFGATNAPKMKFLFSVSFTWHPSLVRDAFGTNPGFANLSAPAHEYDNGLATMGYMSYDCKTASRPTVNVQFTDVNRYNFREKIATKKEYGPLTLSFYDDNQNSAHDIFSQYLMMLAPDMRETSLVPYEGFINADTSPVTDVTSSRSSIGNLPSGMAHGLLQNIRVSHHYSPGYRDGSGVASIHYDYINPKLQTITFDDLDMSISDASLITAVFVFDALVISKDEYVESDAAGDGLGGSGSGTNGQGGNGSGRADSSLPPAQFPPPITGEIDGYVFGSGFNFI